VLLSCLLGVLKERKFNFHDETRIRVSPYGNKEVKGFERTTKGPRTVFVILAGKA